jgi:hypothetical protein
MTCGIYKLSFKDTNKVYIGQSQNIEYRYRQHLSAFRNGSNSKILQEAYATFGLPSIEVLIEANLSELDDLENNAIEVYESYSNGFNTQQSAGDIPRLVGEEHPGSKYSNYQIEHAFLLLCEKELTHAEIAIQSGVSKNMVNHIAVGTCHSWLSNIYPDEYERMLSLKPAAGDSNTRGKFYPTVVSPNGTLYNISNLRAFSREHNIPYSSLNGLVNQRTDNVRGWKVFK